MHVSESELYSTSLVDTNSTRTESGVAIRLDPDARARSAPWKATDYNGNRQVIRPSPAMEAGLKILVSAVQSRPSPPFFSKSCPPWNFSRTDFVPEICARLGHTLAHSERRRPT